MVKRPSRMSRLNYRRNSASTSGSSSTTRISKLICLPLPRGCHARKNDLELGKFAGPGVDLDRSGVLLDDNAGAQRETKTREQSRSRPP